MVGPGFFSVPLHEVKMNYLMSDSVNCWDWSSEPFLEYIRHTNHPDVDWLIKVISTGSLSLNSDRFLSCPCDSGRHLYYASLFCDKNGARDLISQCLVKNPESRLYKYLLYNLSGMLKLTDFSKEWQDEKNKKFEEGARLGDKHGIINFAWTLPISNILRWYLQICSTRYDWFRESIYVTDISILFHIGELTKRYVNTKHEALDDCMWNKLFPSLYKWRIFYGKRRVLIYYRTVCDMVRMECIYWALCSRKMKINRDVRGIILKKIWNSRFDGRRSTYDGNHHVDLLKKLEEADYDYFRDVKIQCNGNIDDVEEFGKLYDENNWVFGKLCYGGSED